MTSAETTDTEISSAEISSVGKFVDLQLNGYAGVDFNADALDTQQVIEICQRLRAEGVDCVLATVITDTIDAMCRRLSNLCAVREQSALVADVLRGIHIEGPFLNEQDGYLGAHPKAAAVPASLELTQRLLDAAQGLVRIVTLAPERDAGSKVTRFLADQGICVSAGHCNPTLDELQAAIEAGLTMFTHLGNGCPLSMHRHDNIVQRVLSLSEQLRIGFIADGVHVPFPALGNYLRAAGSERAFVVTDAIQAAGLGPGKFKLGAQEVVVDESLATWSADRSHLVGSAGTMPMTADNLRVHLGMTDEEIRRLTYDNPRAAIGLS